MNQQRVTSIDNALKLIKTLLELNLYDDWSKMDIHVKMDSDSTIIEWKDISVHSDAGFRWVDEDQVIMNKVEHPDGSHEYVFPNDVDKNMETWIRNNPDWKMTSHGTWTNEEENRLFNIENKAINWPKLIVPDVTRKVTEKDNLVTVISDVPEKILAATSYIVFGDEGLNLLAREKGDTPDSPGSTPGKIDGAYEPSEPIKIDKIDCGIGEKDVTIHRYYSSYVNSNQIYFVNSKHEPIYLIEVEKN